MKLDIRDKKIFNYLFDLGKISRDPDGTVAACLTDDKDRILFSSVSASDGIRHAEDLVLEQARSAQVDTSKLSLYTTLEPCSKRSKQVEDCASLIVKQPVKRIIIGANDPEWSQDTKSRLEKAGITYCLVEDQLITRKCIELFNSTIKDKDKRKSLL